MASDQFSTSPAWLSGLGHVRRATLATGSLILPLRHPIHVAKAAASLENLSGGRFVMGVASGDRPVEFPAFGREHALRGAAFQESPDYLQHLLAEDYPSMCNGLPHFPAHPA